MSLYEIVSLTGFLVGSVLHGVLLGLIYQRKNKTPSERAFLFLVFAVAMWHVGNAISIFSLVLFDRRVASISYVADAIAYVGIGFIPSLLLHTSILYMAERGWNLAGRLQWLITSAIYLPVLPFSIAIRTIIFSKEQYLFTSVEPFVKPFILWLVVALGVTAIISRKVADVAEEAEDQRFHLYISWVLTFVSCFIGFTLLLKDITYYYMGNYLVLAAMLSSIFPSVIFSYFVYRFNYMEFVLRRSLFYSFLTLILICLYYFGIKQFSNYLGRHYGANARVVEATLIIALVYWFPSLKEKLQNLTRMLLFRVVADSEYLLNDLSHAIGEDSLVNLSRLLGYIVETIKNSTGAKKVSLLLFKGEKLQAVGDEGKRSVSLKHLRKISEYFSSGELTALDRYEIKDVATINEMKSLDFNYIFPLFEERRLIGLLCLGRSTSGLPLPSDSLEQLLLIANQIASALGKARLIDEKLRLERKIMESEKLLSLGRLSASVAHEVKNPLSSIKSIAQVLKEELKEDAHSQEALSIIVDEIGRLTKVVNQLLRFARPTGVDLNPSGVNDPPQAAVGTPHTVPLQSYKPSEIVEGVLLVLASEARQNGVTISSKIPGDLPRIRAEDGALQEVFFNLIHNAIQAMPKGGTLSLSAKPGRNQDIEVTIADTGPGIPKDIVDKIFEPFYTTKQTGTGLGLAIVKKRLEEMDGKIDLKTGPTGTRFILHLPAEELISKEVACNLPEADSHYKEAIDLPDKSAKADLPQVRMAGHPSGVASPSADVPSETNSP
jgi:signal transduction histidine kinase